MRKFAILLLSLVLCLCVLPISVFATVANYTLTLTVAEGTTLTYNDASVYTLPAPAAGEGKAFAGWYAPASGDKEMVFLPAGAVVTESVATHLTAVFIRMATRPDAEIRLTDGDEGVRFVTDINREDFALLSDYTTVLSMGTLIVQEVSLLLTAKVLTHRAIEAVSDARYNKYLDVETTGTYTETRNIFSIAGSVSKIPSQKLYTEFAGVGYLKVIYSDGTEGYIYADFTTEGETKLYSLAVEAFGDRVEVQDDAHPNKTSAGYSPYEPSQISFMQSVLDRVINLDFVQKNGKWTPVILPNVKAYNAPFTVIGTKNNEFTYFCLVVKQDSDYRFDEDFYILLENGNLRYIYDKDTYTQNELCNIQPENAGKVMTVDFKA